MDRTKFENSLSSASILKYEISSKFPCRSRSFDCRAGAGGEMTGVCTALENAIIQYFAVVVNL